MEINILQVKTINGVRVQRSINKTIEPTKTGIYKAVMSLEIDNTPYSPMEHLTYNLKPK